MFTDDINDYEIIMSPRIPRILEHRHEQEYPEGALANPLLISCSGGGGHIAAIKSFASWFFDDIALVMYAPPSYKDKPVTATSTAIYITSRANHFSLIKKATQHLKLPALPTPGALNAAVKQLYVPTPRIYCDMLLDVFPEGYQSAAIWNIFQRDDNKEELANLISLQSSNDQANDLIVYNYFYNLLIDAENAKFAYTEVISTQALGLPALCRAVKAYNALYKKNIVIHQYMTDLPTQGAVHFFPVLTKLNPDEQEQIKLYAVNMTRSILHEFFPNGHYFKGVYTIGCKANPLVRFGFYNPQNDNSKHFDKPVCIKIAMDDNDFSAINMKVDESGTVTINKEKTWDFEINANAKIASIMLGSQASTDAIKYVEHLINNEMDNVFVFGGTNTAIKQKVEQLVIENPQFKNKIILLGNQEDDLIASLMTRSNIIIIRSGGLSVMEQMAMNHHADQLILIHHADSDSIQLKSGIPWEDCNADELISIMKAQNINVFKTCPNKAYMQINTRMDYESSDTVENSPINPTMIKK